jgi:hypothetical protein
MTKITELFETIDSSMSPVMRQSHSSHMCLGFVTPEILSLLYLSHLLAFFMVYFMV